MESVPPRGKRVGANALPIVDCQLEIDLRAGVPIVNLKSAIDNVFAPTRYREVVLTPFL